MKKCQTVHKFSETAASYICKKGCGAADLEGYGGQNGKERFDYGKLYHKT